MLTLLLRPIVKHTPADFHYSMSCRGRLWACYTHADFGVLQCHRSKGAASEFNVAVSSVQGTKEWAECANRGTCNRANGQCTCLWPYFKPSNQFGAAGTFWDCGYKVGQPQRL